MHTVEDNIKLVGFAIKKYFNNGNDFDNLGIARDDLYQIGCIGLIKAVERFDKKLGYSFSTFAVRYITGEIYRELTNNSSIVRFPKDIKNIGREIVKSDVNYSLEEIMEKYEVTYYKASVILECVKNYYIKSLDEPIGSEESGNDFTLGELIPAKNDFIPFELKEELEERLSVLTDRERQVILASLERNNQTHVAKQLGITQVSVSRYLRSAIEKINKNFHPVGVYN